jgi:hypothetical protein
MCSKPRRREDRRAVEDLANRPPAMGSDHPRSGTLKSCRVNVLRIDTGQEESLDVPLDGSLPQKRSVPSPHRRRQCGAVHGDPRLLHHLADQGSLVGLAVIECSSWCEPAWRTPRDLASEEQHAIVPVDDEPTSCTSNRREFRRAHAPAASAMPKVSCSCTAPSVVTTRPRPVRRRRAHPAARTLRHTAAPSAPARCGRRSVQSTQGRAK